MVSAPPSKTAFHAVLGAVLQVRDGRASTCCSGSAPARPLRRCLGAARAARSNSTSRSSSRLAAPTRRRSTCRSSPTLEQLETLRRPGERNPLRWELATAYLGLVPSNADPAVPADTKWHPVDKLPPLAFDHQPIVLAARERLRAKLSYTNIGFALAPETFTVSELRDLYLAALGHDVSATNLRRILLRRGLLQTTGLQRDPGPEGGRPAALFRFSTRTLAITDQFAVLRPPRR